MNEDACEELLYDEDWKDHLKKIQKRVQQGEAGRKALENAPGSLPSKEPQMVQYDGWWRSKANHGMHTMLWGWHIGKYSLNVM